MGDLTKRLKTSLPSPTQHTEGFTLACATCWSECEYQAVEVNVYQMISLSLPHRDTCVWWPVPWAMAHVNVNVEAAYEARLNANNRLLKIMCDAKEKWQRLACSVFLRLQFLCTCRPCGRPPACISSKSKVASGSEFWWSVSTLCECAITAH